MGHHSMAKHVPSHRLYQPAWQEGVSVSPDVSLSRSSIHFFCTFPHKPGSTISFGLSVRLCVSMETQMGGRKTFDSPVKWPDE